MRREGNKSLRRFLIILLLILAAPAQAETPSLPWQKWDPALFDRAARDRAAYESGSNPRRLHVNW